MKAIMKRKTAALVAFFMIASMLLPIVAFAAQGFSYLTHNASNGTVVGRVYTDTYVAGATPVVVVYDKDGNRLHTSVQVTYVNNYTVDGHVYYNVTADVSAYSSTYFPLNFRYYYDSVNTSTYVGQNVVFGTVTPPNFGGGGGAGGGELTASADGSVSASALEAALADGEATITITGDLAKLPAIALTKGGKVTIVANGASYELQLDVLDLEALAKELGVELKDMTINVTVAALKGEAAAQATKAAEAAGGKVVGGIFEFKIEAVSGSKKVEVNNFDKFLKRTVELTGEAANAVGVRISGNTANPVPTVAGESEAAIYSKSNSVYTVIDVEAKSFADLAGHWAVKDIEKLAGKLIVNGTGAGKFEPARNVTRAEFAAMVVRALGLEAAGEAKFSDVSSSAWYAGAVAAAAEAGIVKGDGKGFRPNDQITRAELAAMVVRAQAVAGKEIELTNAEVNAALASFTDAGNLGWAKAEVAAAVEAGLVKGQAGNKIAGSANASRAEAAALIIRLLGNAGFIS